jgi:hypothetical protein
MPIANVDVLDAEYVIVHRYHPSRHGVIVDDIMPLELPTWPVSRSKFTYASTLKTKNCAKLFVPRLKKALAVLIDDEAVNVRFICLATDVPLPCKSQTSSLANIGKSVDKVVVIPDLFQTEKPLDLTRKFVRVSSISNPF